LEAAKEAIQMQ